jgi:organic radical activating enzyme
MEVINHGVRDWLIGLGKPIVSDEIEYRFMRYVSKYEVDKGYVLVNNITSAIVYVWKSEFLHLLEKGWHNDYMRFLKEHFFLVPLDYDDYEECEKLRKRFLPDLDKSTCFSKPSYFTILSTTECNARCFYCYEKGRKQFPMTDEMAAKVGDFIIKVRDKEKAIHIGWFGGEPTFNTRAMDIIYDKLIEAGVPYNSSIISNAYLIDEQMCKNFVEKYKISHIQVTIDGFGEKYDRVKNYIYDDEGSAFDRVIDNVERLDLKVGTTIANIKIKIPTVKTKSTIG